MKVQVELMVSNNLQVNYKVVSPIFQPEYLPKYASKGAAGLDLHACIEQPLIIGPQQRVRIPTGIAMEMPGPHVVALVYARSGLAWRHGLGLPNGVGVIDSDYTGELQVLLMNFSDTDVVIQPGDRIAQVVFSPVYVAEWTRVEAIQPTERGTGGFGSTGVTVEIHSR